jgi:YD repeat-containing protein
MVTVNNRTTTLSLDGSGNLTQITNPDGGLHTFTYDGGHRMTGETFGNLQNEWAYSASGALATITVRRAQGSEFERVYFVVPKHIRLTAINGSTADQSWSISRLCSPASSAFG